MPKFRKPVELSLPEKAIVSVRRAEFAMIGRHDAKGDDVLKPALVWTEVTADPEVPDYAFKFTTGSSLEIVEGGARLKGAKPDQSLNLRSGYGYLVDCVLNTDAPMAKDGYTGPGEMEAAAWSNSKWLMEAEDIPGIPPREGQRPPQRMKVVKYLGTADTPATAGGAPSTAPADGATADAGGDGELEQEAELMTLAAEAGNKTAFMKAVLAKPALRAYLSAMGRSKDLTSGALYTALTT